MLVVALVMAANPYLDEGRRLVNRMHFPEAESLLRQAQRAGDTSDDERREAAHLLVRAVLAQGRTQEAQDVYAAVLADDPDLPPPRDVAPSQRDAFMKAKRQLYPDDFVRLTARDDHVELVDPWGRVAAVKLVACDGAARPVEPLANHRRWYASEGGCELTAFDANGAELSRIALAQSPAIRAAAPAAVVSQPAVDETTPKRWWPTLTAGAFGLAAVGTAVALGVSGSADVRSAAASDDVRAVRAFEGSARDKAIAGNVLVALAVAAALLGVVFIWVF